MGGSDDQPKKKQPTSRLTRSVADPCDLEFTLDLVGLRSIVAKNVAVGDKLSVELDVRGNVKSVVCKTPSGDVVGALAAFRGLAQLINCLERGLSYEAIVQASSSTQCTVLARRS
jgi:hypothetical protein